MSGRGKGGKGLGKGIVWLYWLFIWKNVNWEVPVFLCAFMEIFGLEVTNTRDEMTGLVKRAKKKTEENNCWSLINLGFVSFELVHFWFWGRSDTKIVL